MNHQRSSASSFVLLAAVALLALACGGSIPSTSRPTGAASVSPSAATPSAFPTVAPSDIQSGAPVPGLDPSLSDAGIVALVVLTNDTRGGRDGTHEIIAVDSDGSYCLPDLSEPTYTAVAWYDDAPNGQIHRFSVSVPSGDIPADDGTVTDIGDGGVSFDFVSASGFGTQYTGAAGRDNEGSSTINVTRDGPSVIFDFEGETYDGVTFAGQLICADG